MCNSSNTRMSVDYLSTDLFIKSPPARQFNNCLNYSTLSLHRSLLISSTANLPAFELSATQLYSYVTVRVPSHPRQVETGSLNAQSGHVY